MSVTERRPAALRRSCRPSDPRGSPPTVPNPSSTPGRRCRGLPARVLCRRPASSQWPRPRRVHSPAADPSEWSSFSMEHPVRIRGYFAPVRGTARTGAKGARRNVRALYAGGEGRRARGDVRGLGSGRRAVGPVERGADSSVPRVPSQCRGAAGPDPSALGLGAVLGAGSVDRESADQRAVGDGGREVRLPCASRWSWGRRSTGLGSRPRRRRRGCTRRTRGRSRSGGWARW